MAFETINEFTQAQTDEDGLIPFGQPGFTTLNAEVFRNTLKDISQAFQYQSLCGVLSGGVCTAALLVVTVPAGTYYVAGGMVWHNESAETATVADAATNYVWGCCDGELRVTTTLTQDIDFSGNRSCLLTKSVASGGVAVLDNSVQQRARTADHTNRIVGENALVFAPVLDSVPATFRGTIPLGSQYAVFDKFANAGTLVINGKLRVEG
jgi:hypothetical protein